jgi:ABC-type amino acid transport substrate-binding protein
MPHDPAAGPTGFQQALLTDLAKRLQLEVIYLPAEPGTEASALRRHRADAAAPAPIRIRTAAAIAYSAPYYRDPNTGTLYGIATLAGPDPEEDTPLLEDLNEALSELKDDGTLQKLYDKWLPGSEVPDQVLNDETG